MSLEVLTICFLSITIFILLCLAWAFRDIYNTLKDIHYILKRIVHLLEEVKSKHSSSNT